MARVLLVDDDRAGLEIRRLIFEQAGHEVAIAYSREEALSTPMPDAVILDLRLPELEDGLALIRDLRRAAPRARIIVFSGRIEDLNNRPERAMVDQVFLKPTPAARLLDSLPKEPRPSGSGS